MRLLLLVIVATATGCLRTTTFTCAENADCVGAGPQAACDLQAQACTFADSSCTSVRRYADNAGSHSGACVGEGDNGDAPPVGNCPAGFSALPNAGPRGHRYLLLATAGSWSAQRDACAAAMGFLAFPDGTTLADAQAELAAVRTLAGDGAWFGVDDIIAEGTYVTSLNTPVSAITAMLLTTTGNPDKQDCFRGAAAVLDDDDCQQTRKAACECVP